MPSFDVVSGASITLGGYRSTNIEESLVHHIDHSFLADEPESWFRLLFKHEQWDISYSDRRREIRAEDVHTEQVLFQYQNPWTVQMRWSANAAEVLSGFQHAASKEPVLLEWTNMMANHWSCIGYGKNWHPSPRVHCPHVRKDQPVTLGMPRTLFACPYPVWPVGKRPTSKSIGFCLPIFSCQHKQPWRGVPTR